MCSAAEPGEAGSLHRKATAAIKWSARSYHPADKTETHIIIKEKAVGMLDNINKNDRDRGVDLRCIFQDG